MTTTFYNWQDLRASWVNGDLTDCREFLSQTTKTRLFKILDQALSQIYESDYPQGHIHSGDIIDLREMIRLLVK